MTEPARQTPGELLKQRGELADDIVAVRTNGHVMDLLTPVSADAKLEPIHASEPDGLAVIRHSAAHVMADAVQRLFPGTQVTIGPAIDAGFYYDFARPDGQFSDKDLQAIEKEMRRIIKDKRPFVREVVSRQEAHDLFEKMGETYKLQILDSIPGDEAISLYRHGHAKSPQGTWVDLCEGPHVPNTKAIGAVKLTSVAGAYWRGDEKNPMLQRVYGTAFPTEEALAEHLKLLEEARARDHRKLGKELELFMFHEYAPAMPFFLPRGASVYHRLVDYIRDLYVDYGYEEVITPQIFDKRLFQTSGHLANYRENMFFATTEDRVETIEPIKPGQDHAAYLADLHEKVEHTCSKPMNCPSHCLIFGHRRRSYRELPWRVADFGRLHRHERAGVVHGLARVRSFSQDDAHIFCAEDQIEQEILSFNQLLFEVYAAFDFKDVAVKLALRPEKRIGNDELWDRAESALRKALVASNVQFEELPGEGAFYGPKLEFHVTDALKRSWQLGTIQLDYGLPERFELEYIGKDGASHRPVMLHRAILGSVERFYGIYLEHVAGKFPVWIAPEQAILVTVSEKQADYALKVQAELKAARLRINVDVSGDKLGAKIRNARNLRYPYIGVIGEAEAEANTITPRSSTAGELAAMSVAEFKARLIEEAKPPRLRRVEH
ncbi:MAG TPA: threonine--tRNA ligase [Polyangiaceae bacterium]|jgi:threonyl-tRNA synthetase|nr:threonine--tRNA ligase [Polyangiaceae bacterium]